MGSERRSEYSRRHPKPTPYLLKEEPWDIGDVDQVVWSLRRSIDELKRINRICVIPIEGQASRHVLHVLSAEFAYLYLHASWHGNESIPTPVATPDAPDFGYQSKPKVPDVARRHAGMPIKHFLEATTTRCSATA